MTLFELNEKYKDYPVKTNEYEVDGKKYTVHSRFVGDKSVNGVILQMAYDRALEETLKKAE